jgi:hypothetical protein
MLMKRKVELEQLVGLGADDVQEVALEAALSCECAFTGSWWYVQALLWCCVAFDFLGSCSYFMSRCMAQQHTRIHFGVLLKSLQYLGTHIEELFYCI